MPGPPRVPPENRFWGKIDQSGECWLWTAYKDPNGYGRFSVNRKAVLAHRWSWERVNGPVPEGHELDHLCRNRSCVRPDHLEAVPHQVNNQRAYGPICKRGHSDWYVQPDGRRRCRECIRIRAREKWPERYTRIQMREVDG